MSDFKVELIDHMGSDLSVVNAARVSFDKTSTEDENGDLQGKDIKLIKYLAEHNHWSPFAHAFASFRIKAPIFVARQLVKHQIGLSWNEVSRRYVNSSPEVYDIKTWRKAAANVKQGSSDEEVVWITRDERVETAYWRVVDYSLTVYEDMIKAGVCAEQARAVLPQGMMTEWIWSGSLYAFARVANLRLDSHAQRETQEVAQRISDQMFKVFPYSWKTLVTGYQTIEDIRQDTYKMTTEEQKANLRRIHQAYLDSYKNENS